MTLALQKRQRPAYPVTEQSQMVKNGHKNARDYTRMGVYYNLVTELILKEKKWCPKVDLNHRHTDFQSVALPTELFGQHIQVVLSERPKKTP